MDLTQLSTKVLKTPLKIIQFQHLTQSAKMVTNDCNTHIVSDFKG